MTEGTEETVLTRSHGGTELMSDQPASRAAVGDEAGIKHT
jgi:hypothetical protein